MDGAWSGSRVSRACAMLPQVQTPRRARRNRAYSGYPARARFSRRVGKTHQRGRAVREPASCLVRWALTVACRQPLFGSKHMHRLSPSLSLIFVVRALNLSRFSRERHTRFADQLLARAHPGRPAESADHTDACRCPGPLPSGRQRQHVLGGGIQSCSVRHGNSLVFFYDGNLSLLSFSSRATRLFSGDIPLPELSERRQDFSSHRETTELLQGSVRERVCHCSHPFKGFDICLPLSNIRVYGTDTK